MIKIEIDTNRAQRFKGEAKSTGKPYDFQIQPAWAWLFNRDGTPAKYPKEFKYRLGGEDLPLQVGAYTLHPSGFYVRDDALHFTPVLTPVKS